MKRLIAVVVAGFGLLFVGASSPSCQQGYFCVVDYPTPQDAITAASAAGGGTVLFTRNTLTSVPIVVPDKINIVCTSPGIAIETSSPTADLFDVPGTNVEMRSCALNYAGPGTKTAGTHVKSTGVMQLFDGLIFGGNCFLCMDLDGVEARLSNIVFGGNFAAAAAPGSGVIKVSNEVTHLSNITIGATPAGNFYTFGVKVVSGAVDSVNLELLTTKYGVWMAPPTGAAAFWKGTTTYLDNCLVVCFLAQTQGGAIGYADFSLTEFGAQPGGTPITIDTQTFGGHVGMIRGLQSQVFNYPTFPEPGIPVAVTPSNNSIDLRGSLGVIDFSHSSIGDGANGGFVINAGANCNCFITDNVLHGNGAGFWGGAVVSALRMHSNIMNGAGINQGGNPASSFYNNLP